MKQTLILICLICGYSTFSQSFLNLSFECPKKQSQKPDVWFTRGPNYTIQLDKTQPKEGKYSLKMQSNFPEDKHFAVCTDNLRGSMAAGKKVVLKGWVKTENVTDGYAGLWFRVDDKNELIFLDNMKDRGLKNTNNWTQMQIETTVDSTAHRLMFGGIFNGKGTAWFDDFEIWIDGTKYRDIQPRITPPTAQELAWLKANIIPLKTHLPTESLANLAALDEVIGDAKVIGLGESTHGSREIFQIKHRLLKYLNATHNFRIFSIEASMPEAYKINDFVLKNEGNPKDLITGMYFWTWRTKEVLAMVKWMQEFNESNNEQIQFTGFDMQFIEGPIAELKMLLPDAADIQLDSLKMTWDVLREQSRKNRRMLMFTPKQQAYFDGQMAYLKKEISQGNLTKKDHDWAIQNVKILEQAAWQPANKRDQYMAENLLWIKEQNPQQKIVAWAHNEHIKKTGKRMGEWLADSLKQDYLSVGFAFYDGSYTSQGDKGLQSYQAQTAYIGTYEYFFNAIDEPIFLLDLRNTSKDDPACAWLFDHLKFRKVGSRNIKEEFFPTKITEDFDVLIFIKSSSYSRLF